MNNERNQLIENLRRIKENNYDLHNGEQVSDYIDLMLKYIGDADYELRDGLIYLTFVYWIENKGYFSNEQLINLLETILSSDYLFYNIGSEGDDSVLRRSFSVLLINPIFCVHLNKKFLGHELIMKTKDCLIRYINEEKDLRGYDHEKGWVHALAHASDGLNVLLVCDGITDGHCKEVLEVIKSKLFFGKYVLQAEEDERLVNAIYYSILDNNLLSVDDMCDWIESLADVIKIENRITRYMGRVNVKNIARSLYFRMIHVKNYEKLNQAVLDLEKKLNYYIN